MQDRFGATARTGLFLSVEGAIPESNRDLAGQGVGSVHTYAFRSCALKKPDSRTKQNLASEEGDEKPKIMFS